MDDELMVSINIGITRNGVVTSQFFITPEVQRNVADLLIVGALETVTQTLRMERMKRVTPEI